MYSVHAVIVKKKKVLKKILISRTWHVSRMSSIAVVVANTGTPFLSVWSEEWVYSVSGSGYRYGTFLWSFMLYAIEGFSLPIGPIWLNWCVLFFISMLRKPYPWTCNTSVVFWNLPGFNLKLIFGGNKKMLGCNMCVFDCTQLRYHASWPSFTWPMMSFKTARRKGQNSPRTSHQSSSMHLNMFTGQTLY